MDATEFIRSQVAAWRTSSDAVTQGLTDEQVNWVPPGTGNPIGATLIHLFVTEDILIQQMLSGRPLVWEGGGWGARLGLSALPGPGRGWDEVRRTTLSAEPLLQYAQAVRVATDEYVARLDDAELRRTVNFLGSQRPAADVFAMVIAHSLGHLGEIAAIKGFQGLKGLPF